MVLPVFLYETLQPPCFRFSTFVLLLLRAPYGFSILLGSRCVRCGSVHGPLLFMARVQSRKLQLLFVIHVDTKVRACSQRILSKPTAGRIVYFLSFRVRTHEVAQLISYAWRSSQPARIPSSVFRPRQVSGCERVVTRVELTTHEDHCIPYCADPRHAEDTLFFVAEEDWRLYEEDCKRGGGTWCKGRANRARRGGREAKDLRRGDGRGVREWRRGGR